MLEPANNCQDLLIAVFFGPRHGLAARVEAQHAFSILSRSCIQGTALLKKKACVFNCSGLQALPQMSELLRRHGTAVAHFCRKEPSSLRRNACQLIPSRTLISGRDAPEKP